MAAPKSLCVREQPCPSCPVSSFLQCHLIVPLPWTLPHNTHLFIIEHIGHNGSVERAPGQDQDVLGSWRYLGQDQLGQVVLFCFFLVLGIETRPLQMLGVSPASELHSSFLLFIVLFGFSVTGSSYMTLAGLGSL